MKKQLNKMRDWLTLKEVEEAYESIKADTLRSYITRKTVIPEQCYQKLGNQWFVKKSWIEKKYKRR